MTSVQRMEEYIKLESEAAAIEDGDQELIQ